LQPGRIARLHVLARSDDPGISALALEELLRAAFYGELGSPPPLTPDERRLFREAWQLLGLIPSRLH
jgi:hypothetical protein